MSKEELRAFGKRLRAAREVRGLMQQDVGHAVGIDPNRISNWELGYSYPQCRALIQICKALGCSADYLLDTGMDRLTPEESLLIERVRNLGPVRMAMVFSMLDHLEELRPAGELPPTDTE